MDRMYKIVDNFIEDPVVENQLHDYLMGDYFPWYYNDYVNYAGDDHYQLTHTFYRNDGWNGDYEPLIPILDRIKPLSLVRVKCNLLPKFNEIIEHGMHNDIANHLLSDNLMTTAVYYVNSNNGYTLLEDGTKIDSVRNRMLLFNSKIAHSGTTSTDARRVVINFNFFERGIPVWKT
jgi:hypothetical protein